MKKFFKILWCTAFSCCVPAYHTHASDNQTPLNLTISEEEYPPLSKQFDPYLKLPLTNKKKKKGKKSTSLTSSPDTSPLKTRPVNNDDMADSENDLLKEINLNNPEAIIEKIANSPNLLVTLNMIKNIYQKYNKDPLVLRSLYKNYGSFYKLLTDETIKGKTEATSNHPKFEEITETRYEDFKLFTTSLRNNLENIQILQESIPLINKDHEQTLKEVLDLKEKLNTIQKNEKNKKETLEKKQKELATCNMITSIFQAVTKNKIDQLETVLQQTTKNIQETNDLLTSLKKKVGKTSDDLANIKKYEQRLEKLKREKKLIADDVQAAIKRKEGRNWSNEWRPW